MMRYASSVVANMREPVGESERKELPHLEFAPLGGDVHQTEKQ